MSLNSQKEELLLSIQEKLKEEQWTRSMIESYHVKNFIEIDKYIQTALEEKFANELDELCKENLKKSQDSLISLYIVGVLSLESSMANDTHLPQIIKIFMDQKKYNIGEFLSEKILSYRENKYALKTLATIYEEQDREEELFNVRKRLVLIDSKDANNAKFLGEYYQDEDKELAMFYYRLAIERFIQSRRSLMVEDLWNKMITLAPEDVNMITSMAQKVRSIMGDEKVADIIYNRVVKNFLKKENTEKALLVLKLVVQLAPQDKKVRKSIEDCYRVLYADHGQLEYYLKVSAIGQSWKPYKEAIRFFETHIAFDKGSYVSHRTWGIGKVVEIEKDKVLIDFNGHKNHEMSLNIALRALTILDENHIDIWKAFRLEELKEMTITDPIAVLKIILENNSVPEIASKEVKAILVPDVIEDKAWTRWWNNVKKRMETSQEVIMSLTKNHVIELRSVDQTVYEELVSKFKKGANFAAKLSIAIDFLVRGGDVNAEEALPINNYFNEVFHSSSETIENKITAYLFLKDAKFIDLENLNFDTHLLFSIKNIAKFYTDLSGELKKSFLQTLKMLHDWDIRYVELILETPITKYHTYMIRELINNEKYEMVSNVFVSTMNDYQNNPELFVWAAKIYFDENIGELAEEVGVKDSELIFRLLSIFDVLSAEIDNKYNVGKNKKIISSISSLFFRRKVLDQFIDSLDHGMASSLLSLIHSSVGMDNNQKDTYSALLQAKYPDLDVQTAAPVVKLRHPFIVTKVSYEIKQKELENLVQVEIPANSANIGEAMEKGDLRENAEYKAALEKQDQLKAAVAKLEKELKQAKLLQHSEVNTSRVDVGTKVSLEEEKEGAVTYQILGQWSVDFDKGIISYHSPLGQVLLDKKKGDVILFDFNGETKKFKVIDITLADFED